MILFYNNMGDANSLIDNTKAALAQYKASMMISQQLVEQDPSNTQFKRDLSVSHNKLGDSYQRQGDTKDALAQYQAATVIREKLLNNNQPQTGYDLIYSLKRLGQTYSQVGNYTSAAKHSARVIQLRDIGVGVVLTENQIVELNQHKNDYLNWSWYALHTDDVGAVVPTLSKVINYLPEGDEAIVELSTNLAHAYLINSDYDSAVALYGKYKGFAFSDGRLWDDVIVEDIETLQKNGVTHPSFSRILEEVFSAQ
jgi:tetratricopeptide (TPR) repeat protein